MELTLTTVCLVVAILYVTVQYIRSLRKKLSSTDTIPKYRSPSVPFLGHALEFFGSRDELFSKYSKLVLEKAIPRNLEIGSFRLGRIRIVFIISPVLAAEVLRSSKLTQKTYFYSFLHPWLGQGLLTSGGEKWRSRRRLLEPSFHSSVLQDFLDVMNDQTKIFVTLQHQRAKSKEEFDIFKSVTLLSLDVICETAMGKRINAQRNQNMDYIKAIQNVNEVIQHRQKSPWLWPNFLFKLSPSGRKYFKNLAILHDFTRSVLNDRASSYDEDSHEDKKRLAFLDMLLKQERLGNITREGIEEEVDTFMFAGHDTTATAISWAIHMIGHHEDVQQRLHQEQDEIFGQDKERDVTMEDLRKMTYMDLVVKECLRMFPSVPAIGRTIDRECMLGEHKIPAGTECIIANYIINNNKNFWTEPMKFDPERFRPENSANRHPYAYIPFSAGPRNCIGQRFAMMEEKVALSHIVRNYTVESTEPTKELRLLGDIILRSKSGVKVILRERGAQ